MTGPTETVAKIRPILLAGGSGTRLWPASRKARPKQFLSLIGDETLLQQTARRFAGPKFAPPFVIASDAHRFAAAEQLAQCGAGAGRLVLEPVARNTAAAAAVAALLTEQTDGPEGLLLLAPSDHVMRDPGAFLRAIDAAAPVVAQGVAAVFGVTPDRAETGYGYLELGDSAGPGLRHVVQFVEKPDAARAAAFAADGRHVWNAGVFLFRADQLLAALETHAPDVLAAARGAVDGAVSDLDFLRLDQTALAKSPDISLDYAVMERLDNVACAPMDPGWSDLGSWSAISAEAPRDAQGVAVCGGAAAVECRDTLLYQTEDAPVLVGLGLENMIVVSTPDAVLAAPADRAQDVGAAVAALRARGAPEADSHRRRHRPWGWYETLTRGDRFQVKRIMVAPGGRLSLQSHFHRAEHWVVVAGAAQVTVGDEVRLLGENQSVYVPLGATHRLENPGRLPLFLIEVQSGAYLGEDDIVRYDDVYNRPETHDES